jgi:hypothetical protein
MFGFIKNFFGGIFGFLGRLLGLKKSEYFLDLDAGAKEPAKVAPAKAEPAKAEPAAKKAEPVAAQGVAAAPATAKIEAAKADKAEPAKKGNAEKVKKSKKEKEPAASVPAAAPTPAKVPAAATNGKVSAQADAVVTFAPNNLAPTPSASRRLPGPSMNGFREMARQVKTK